MGSIPGSWRSPGGGNGNPFQYSCLENPMHRGAWWATVHGVVMSQTQLGNRAHSPKASTGRAMAGEPRQCGHKGRGVPITVCQHCPGKPVCIFKYTYADVLFPVSTLFGRRQLLSNYNGRCLLFDKLGIFIPLTTNSGRHPQQTSKPDMHVKHR